jgi:hypothetical protein
MVFLVTVGLHDGKIIAEKTLARKRGKKPAEIVLDFNLKW